MNLIFKIISINTIKQVSVCLFVYVLVINLYTYLHAISRSNNLKTTKQMWKVKAIYKDFVYICESMTLINEYGKNQSN